MTILAISSDRALVVASLLLSFALAFLYLRWRRRLKSLRPLYLPALLVMVFSIPDALLTLQGAALRPAREANPAIRLFLTWAGVRGLCIALIVWVLGWTIFVNALESIRLRIEGPVAQLLAQAELCTVYALAMGNLDGLSSWTHTPALAYLLSSGLLSEIQQHAIWAMPAPTLAYLLYPSLAFGCLCAALHRGLLAATPRILRMKLAVTAAHALHLPL